MLFSFLISFVLMTLAQAASENLESIGNGLSEVGDETISSRSRRSLSDAFRMPGTLWCGRGFRADKLSQLGAYGSADKCCRQHDLGCPQSIGSLKSLHGLYNWRMYTVMHCSCDERFRSCLQMSHSPSADTVGKVFFNVIKTPCFVLKKATVCSSRSWWGKCLEQEERWQGEWREAIPY